MKRFLAKLSYANVTATIALFVALGGASYAATQLPKNSVGAKQLKKGAVTEAKLSGGAKSSLVGAVGPAGPQGAADPAGPKGDPGAPGAPLGWAHFVDGKLVPADSKGVLGVHSGTYKESGGGDENVYCFQLAFKPSTLTVTSSPASTSRSRVATLVAGMPSANPPGQSHAGCPTDFQDAEAEAFWLSPDEVTTAPPTSFWVTFF